MLTINNNSTYSPVFGQLQIAKNLRTKAALRQCKEKTLNSIDQAGQILADDNFITGVIKKVGKSLVLTAKFPKGLVCPEKISLHNLEKIRNPFCRGYIVKDGISDNCIYNDKEGDTDEQNYTDGFGVNFNYSYVEYAAKKLHELNNEFKEYADNGGVLFPTAKQKIEMRIAKIQQKLQKALSAKQRVDDLIKKY